MLTAYHGGGSGCAGASKEEQSDGGKSPSEQCYLEADENSSSKCNKNERYNKRQIYIYIYIRKVLNFFIRVVHSPSFKHMFSGTKIRGKSKTVMSFFAKKNIIIQNRHYLTYLSYRVMQDKF